MLLRYPRYVDTGGSGLAGVDALKPHSYGLDGKAGHGYGYRSNHASVYATFAAS
jgi:hypothetical protein